MRPHRTHHDMTHHTHAWANIPTLAQIQNHLAAHPDSRHLIFCLPANHVIPQWQPENEQQQPLAQAWQEATRCLAHDAVNYIRQWQPETDLWLLPPYAARHLHEHFPQPENIIWHTPPVAQQPAPPRQAWQQPPTRQSETNTTAQPHVLIIGAGIAGAATAHECATRGARVTVLEAHAPATQGSLKLKTALSAASYISPAWQGEHCYGATFSPNNPSRDWHAEDEARNRQALAQLSPYLAQQFADYYAAHPIRQPENECSEFRQNVNEPSHDYLGSLKTQRQPENEYNKFPRNQTPCKPNQAQAQLLRQPENERNEFPQKGHTATRCDCHDHLPAVGAISNPTALRTTYAAYALDKNYRIATPRPYLPNAYANTAHGSRGLATAPLCAAEIAAQICHTPRPLSERLRQALNPNRLIIRQIIRSKTNPQPQP